MQSDERGAERAPARIRRAEETDFAAVCSLYALLHRIHANNHPQVFAPTDESPLTRLDFRAALAAKDVLVLVVERAGDVIAAAQASVAYPSDTAEMRPRRTVYVSHLVTRPDARRQGHGRALMNAIAEWARAKESDMVQLWVWEGNTEASAFYRALGYGPLATLLALPLPGGGPAESRPRPIPNAWRDD